jgi:signal transduction histidine kinase
VGVSIFAYDVTERVESRRATERQRQLLHTLFMQAPAPVVILEGPRLVYRLVNPAYQQIFPGRVLLNKALLEALPELTYTPIPAILNQVYQTGETFVAQEMPLMLARHQGGPLEEIYCAFTCQARRNEQGEVDGIMVFAHEVTEEVAARRVVLESERQTQALAQELAAANEELQAANEEIQATNEELADSNGQLQRTNGNLNRANLDLDNFIYTASHDLKAPINNIEGLMRVLLRSLPPESLLPERVQGIVKMIEHSVERFKKTIANLTEVVKLQKENDDASVVVDVAGVTRGVVLDLDPLIVSSGARIVMDFADCSSVRFSPKNLRSVVYNLLSNAIKYGSPERAPLVCISCRVTADFHVLTVEDNGLGMEARGLSQLFTMFKRFHNHVEGSGIGLYMVKKMVENAGGHIEVESKLDQGTTFRVCLRR